MSTERPTNPHYETVVAMIEGTGRNPAGIGDCQTSAVNAARVADRLVAAARTEGEQAERERWCRLMDAEIARLKRIDEGTWGLTPYGEGELEALTSLRESVLRASSPTSDPQPEPEIEAVVSYETVSAATIEQVQHIISTAYPEGRVAVYDDGPQGDPT